jgi:hypothetical protein
VSSWHEERRADRAEERTQDREDRKQQADQDRQERVEAEQRQRRERAEARRAKEQARAARAARWSSRARWARDNGDITAVQVVMAASMVPALAGQEASLRRMGENLLFATLLAMMLELATWAATAGEARALRQNRNATPFRIAVWVFALVAGSVNYLNGVAEHSATLGIVRAMSSIAPVALWHVVMASRHSAKSRRTMAERRAARAAKRHAKERRKHHKDVHQVFERVMAAAAYGSLSTEQAWQIAWEYVHGVKVPGVTADLIAGQLNAKARLDELTPRPATPFPDLPRDPFPHLSLPGPGPEPDDFPDVYLPPFPAALEAAAEGASQNPTTLVGKGLQTPGSDLGNRRNAGSGTASKADGERPLKPEDLDRVRELADLLNKSGQKLSSVAIRKLLGCRNTYAVRLRNAVLAEREGGGDGPAPVGAR